MKSREREDESTGHPPVPRKPPVLLVMVGVPGTGKSYFVRRLADRIPLAVVQTDQIRRQLVTKPTYSQEENRRVFSIAHREIGRLLRAGKSVAFDATNLYERRRLALYRIAERYGARLVIVRTVAPDEVVAERLQMRLRGADPVDMSEAGWDVYSRMKGEFEEIRRPHIVVDTSLGVESTVSRLAELIRGDR